MPIRCGCGAIATFGVNGDRYRCLHHKIDDDVAIAAPKCFCGTRAHFGPANADEVVRCKRHKLRTDANNIMQSRPRCDAAAARKREAERQAALLAPAPDPHKFTHAQRMIFMEGALQFGIPRERPHEEVSIAGHYPPYW